MLQATFRFPKQVRFAFIWWQFFHYFQCYYLLFIYFQCFFPTSQRVIAPSHSRTWMTEWATPHLKRQCWKVKWWEIMHAVTMEHWSAVATSNLRVSHSRTCDFIAPWRYQISTARWIWTLTSSELRTTLWHRQHTLTSEWLLSWGIIQMHERLGSSRITHKLCPLCWPTNIFKTMWSSQV